MTAPFKAMLVPASELLRPTIVPVSPDLAELERYLQGLPERARYDRDAVMYVNGMGHSMRMARNERVTAYMLEHSDAARRGNFRGVDPRDYYLAGPVVILGERDLGGGATELTDVPQRLIETFGVEQTRGAEQG